MSMNKVKLSQIVKDFIVTLDGDDFVAAHHMRPSETLRSGNQRNWF